MATGGLVSSVFFSHPQPEMGRLLSIHFNEHNVIAPTTPPLRFRFLQGGSRADSSKMELCHIYNPYVRWPQNSRKYMGFHWVLVILPNLYLVCLHPSKVGILLCHFLWCRWPLNRGLHGREGVQERNKGWNAGNQLVYAPEYLHGTCPHGGLEDDHFPF